MLLGIYTTLSAAGNALFQFYYAGTAGCSAGKNAGVGTPCAAYYYLN